MSNAEQGISKRRSEIGQHFQIEVQVEVQDKVQISVRMRTQNAMRHGAERRYLQTMGLSPDGYQVISVGKDQQLKAVGDFQFPEDGGYVMTNRGFADIQPSSDLFVFQTFADQFDDVALTVA